MGKRVEKTTETGPELLFLCMMCTHVCVRGGGGGGRVELLTPLFHLQVIIPILSMYMP